MQKPNEDGLRDATDGSSAGKPRTATPYSSGIEASVRRAFESAAEALDAGDLTQAAALLEALPRQADLEEYAPRYAELPEWMRELIPRERFLSPEFLGLAGKRGMTPMQWASVDALLLQGVPLSGVENLQPSGEAGLVERRLHVARVDTVRHLPPGIEVSDMLWLEQLPVLEGIPDGMRVGMCHVDTCQVFTGFPALFPLLWLNIRECPNFVRLPERIEVAHDFSLYRCNALKSIPEGEVGSDMFITECDAVTDVSADLRVAGLTQISKCGMLKELKQSPSSRLEIFDCPLFDTLPAGLALDTLRLSGCPMRRLPDGMSVVHLDILGLEDLECLPDDLRVTGSLRCPQRLRRDVERLQKVGRVTENVEYLEDAP